MNRIKECRESKGYSQKYISIAMNVSQPTVCAWESGKTSPTNENLVKLSSLLNVSADYLLGISSIDQSEQPAENKSHSQLAQTISDKLLLMTEDQLIELRGYIAGRFGK